eukprot:scaffold220927_cov30-Prasinocladus_malaysianus.AAC.1
MFAEFRLLAHPELASTQAIPGVTHGCKGLVYNVTAICLHQAEHECLSPHSSGQALLILLAITMGSRIICVHSLMGLAWQRVIGRKLQGRVQTYIQSRRTRFGNALQPG